MNALTVGSLFAGIGGFDLGLERAGMRSVWQSEIDPYCQRVLAKHWPDVLRVPDVRDVGQGSVPWVDVICGGFPCQDISVAGRGAGIRGEKSGLWSEMFRVVDELRPRYLVVENVAALVSRGLDVVLSDLASIGFDAEWDCLRASDFGAPHRRERFWLVAYSNEGNGQAGLGDQPQWSREVQALNAGQSTGIWLQAPAATTRMDDGLSRGLDDGARSGALGNALVPQIAEWIGRRIVSYEAEQARRAA